MITWLVMIVVGAMLAPHVLKMGLGILGSQWKLPEDYNWAPFVLGAVFSGITILTFAIMFLFKSQLSRFVAAYKQTS